MKKSCIVALLALTAAWSVSASADGGKEPETDKEKVICKSDTVTGSRLKKKRICMTKSQWEALADRTKQSIDNYGRTAGNGAPEAKGPGF